MTSYNVSAYTALQALVEQQTNNIFEPLQQQEKDLVQWYKEQLILHVKECINNPNVRNFTDSEPYNPREEKIVAALCREMRLLGYFADYKITYGFYYNTNIHSKFKYKFGKCFKITIGW